jgi:hypothetical protein
MAHDHLWIYSNSADFILTDFRGRLHLYRKATPKRYLRERRLCMMATARLRFLLSMARLVSAMASTAALKLTSLVVREWDGPAVLPPSQ